MENAHGFSVRIFVPEGEPEGLRIVEKSNWTGQGLVFPRAIFGEVQRQEELLRTGVYMLWGLEEAEALPRVYVGESDSILPRLNSHAKGKDFWTHTAAFISKDQNLNKAHAKYLESKLVKLAAEAKRCELDNGNEPQLPSLSRADATDAKSYLSDMLLCLSMVGVNFFDKPDASVPKSRYLFAEAQANKIKAQGYDSAHGFVVQANSQVAKKETKTIHSHVSDLRQVLLNKGVLKDSGAAYLFTQDYIFNSPSLASSVVLGRSSNGRTEWKDNKGRTLKEIQEAEFSSK